MKIRFLIIAPAALLLSSDQTMAANNSKYAALDTLFAGVPPVDPANCYHGGSCVLGQKCKNAQGETCICDNDTQNPHITRFYCSTPSSDALGGGYAAN